MTGRLIDADKIPWSYRQKIGLGIDYGLDESDHYYIVVKDKVDAMPTVDAKPKWIPCSERLPEEETDVLVTRTFLGCEDGSFGWNAHLSPKTYVEVAQYFDGEWIALSDEYKVARHRHTEPIAWMPLPKPYEEERK